MAEQNMDWRSEQFRRKVVNQIEEAVRTAASPMTKSSLEMENHVFQKAKTREEYLALVARLILHVKEMNTQKDKVNKGGMGLPQGMPQGGMAQQMDPLNALQTLTMTGTGGMGPAGQQGMMNPQQAYNQQQLIQLQQRQRMMQQRPTLERQDAFMVTSAQHVQSGGQPLPASGSSQPQVSYGQQGLQTGGMGGGTMQTSGMTGQSMPGMSVGSMQTQGVPGTTMQNASMPGGSMQSTGLPGNAVQNSGMQGSTIQSGGMSNTGMQRQPAQPSLMGAQGPQLSPFGQQMAGTGGMQQVQPAVPSPKPSVGMMMSPSPQAVIQNPRAPSPRVLNTPGGPASPSPNTPRSHEEQAYLDKLNKLSKYIEPLKRMINRLTTDKDEERKKDISKMEGLLKILTDPSKRLPMATLLKCEQVLDNLEMSKPSVSSSTSTVTTTPMHMCQPLLDAVAANMQSPMFNHALQQTFGPAMTALYGAPIRAPSPPPKKRKHEEVEEEEIPHILQGEIAQLGSRFKVNLDPTQHSDSKDIHLICKIDDKNLPCVPPISVKVPELYPNVSPECDTSAQDYESSPFLSSIQESLSTLLLRMSNKYTFTELLDKWEMSIRRACAVPS